MANIFEEVIYPQPQRSTFDLSHDVKTSLNIGKLVPLYIEETMPGDNFEISAHSLIKFQPLVHPVMSRMKGYYHFYQVPFRVMWHGWKYFVTGDKQDTYTSIPYFQFSASRGDYLEVKQGGVLDYLGVPPCENMVEPISAFPYLSYSWAIRDYYLDQFIDEEYYQLACTVLDYIQFWKGGNLWELKIIDIFPDHTDPDSYVFGDDDDNIFSLNVVFDRRYAKDYFTSCLPFAQAGDPVKFPINLSGTAAVGAASPNGDWLSSANPTQDSNTKTGDVNGTFYTRLKDSNGQNLDPHLKVNFDAPNTSVENETTIQMLREAFTMETFLERIARIGKKFGDYIKGVFGVTVPDYTYDKAIYIGGDVTPIQISEILQTSETANTPLGERGGNAMSAQSGFIGKVHTYEQCCIIGLFSVLPETTYSQGIPRMFSHIDRFDFAIPQFANLGEQEVFLKELYYSMIQGENNQVFGYLPRYTEYKYRYNRISGQFRSELEKWAITRKFSSAPTLNSEFIATDYDDFKDIFAYYGSEESEVDSIVMHTLFNVKATRALPKYGQPSGLYPQ